MTVVDWFTIGGSVASTGAIIVSLIVFWMQRKNEKKLIEENKRNELKALKSLVYEEVRMNSLYFKSILDFFDDVMNGNVFHLEKSNILKGILIDYTNKKGENKYFQAVPHLSNLIEKHLLDVSRIDAELGMDLIYLNVYIKHYNDTVLCGIDELFTSKPDMSFVVDLIEKNNELMMRYKTLCNSVMCGCHIGNDNPFQI